MTDKNWEELFDEKFSVFDGSQKIIKHVTYSMWIKDFISTTVIPQAKQEGYKRGYIGGQVSVLKGEPVLCTSTTSDQSKEEK